MSYQYEYPRPALSADCLLFGWSQQQIHLLLIQRKHAPFQGDWALPGGFVDIDESPLQGAVRELEEETGLKQIALKPLGAYGAVHRDPRTRVVTVAHWGLVKSSQMKKAVAGDDAAMTRWHPMESLPSLAFDHAEIVSDSVIEMQRQIECHSFGREWLGRSFSAQDLQQVYQAVLKRKFAPRRLAAWLMKRGVIQEASEDQYHWVTPAYNRFQKERWSVLPG